MEDQNPNIDLLLLTAIDPFSYQIQPDLGLMYVAAAAREAGFTVGIRDCRKERWDEAEMGRRVAALRPRVVGIKSFSNEANRVARMAARVRRELPEAVIIAGGPHPSMDPQDTLKRMTAVDYAFVGEAERSVPPFLAWIKAGGRGAPPEEVPGIAYRTGADGEVMVREPVWEQDLDTLPFPAWDLMPPDSYPDEVIGLFSPAFPAAPISGSRGCPYRCNYCGAAKIAGNRFRYRSVDNLLAEIDLLAGRYGVKSLAFVDNSFTSIRPRAVKFFEALIARPAPMLFTFPNGVRANTLDEQLLPLMEKAGCRLVGLGIESSSAETLARMQKDQTTATVRQTVDLIRRTTSLYITGSFILGYPGETLEDVKRTIAFAIGLPVHHAHFCIFIPLPGSTVFQELAAAGQVRQDEWDPDQLTNDSAACSMPGLPMKDLQRLHHLAYLRFYLTPWRLLSLPRQIKSFSHLRIMLRIVAKVLF
jgi:anaerobic magnesium-protoporphyrin IX monomethyl ester cyclase